MFGAPIWWQVKLTHIAPIEKMASAEIVERRLASQLSVISFGASSSTVSRNVIRLVAALLTKHGAYQCSVAAGRCNAD